MNLQPLILTFQLAAVTSFLLFFITLPVAYWLAFAKTRWKVIVEVIVSLPLVLPPTVLGFYLLLVFSPNQGLGKWLAETIGVQLVFSFEGLVFASILYSLPFMVQPIQAGFTNLSPSLKEAAYVLGKSRWETLWRVLLPNIKPALLTGIVLSFAHTIGEFGVVLMIGGNIPGVTKVASIAIYDEVESLNYAAAHLYSGVLLVITFVILLVVYLFRNKNERKYK
ncbi:MAG: molybdate ABC transporter permease subunit [Saprospiraceae bacterium]